MTSSFTLRRGCDRRAKPLSLALLFVCAAVTAGAAACSSSPAPGTVISSEILAIPADKADAGDCTAICPLPTPSCSTCSFVTMSDGVPGVLCELLECGPPPTWHE